MREELWRPNGAVERSTQCSLIKQHFMVLLYAPNGTSQEYRTREAADRLIAGGHVKPVYKHLKAISLPEEDR